LVLWSRSLMGISRPRQATSSRSSWSIEHTSRGVLKQDRQVWECRAGVSRNLMFPERQYSVNDERAQLRPAATDYRRDRRRDRFAT
jgi:hypothetical protein